MRQIPVKIWLPIILAAAIAVSLAIYFTFPREEKTPEVSIPEKTPTAEEEISPPEGIIWNVPEGQVNPEIEKEIKKAVYNDEGLNSLRKELEEKGEFISIETLEMEGEWALIGYAARYKENREFVPTEGMGLLARKVNQNWDIAHFTALSADEKYCQWFPLVPDTLLPPDVKEFDKMICGD